MKHLDEAAKEAVFERCMDFPARMIEKYGPEIVFTDQESKQCEDDNEDAKASPLLFWANSLLGLLKKTILFLNTFLCLTYRKYNDKIQLGQTFETGFSVAIRRVYEKPKVLYLYPCFNEHAG
ncbi:MAG: hypothetical protein IKN04_19900 [Clostridia bacterium]|nr:hypothetical protein [Clostridia bacterium]